MILSLLFASLAAQSKPTRTFGETKPPQPTICQQVRLLTPDMLGNITSEEKKSMCFNEEVTVAISENCKKDCPLLSEARNHKKALKYSAYGTPGSWLCKDLGGNSRAYFLSGLKPNLEEKYKIHVCEKNKDIISANRLLLEMGK